MTPEQQATFREFQAMFANAELAPPVIEELCAAVAEPDMSSWVCMEGTNEIGSLVWLVEPNGEVVMTSTGIPSDVREGNGE